MINCNVPAAAFNMASDSTFRVRGVAEKPHQPRSFSFPKREFGNKCIVKRSFQPRWFDQWPWLDYSEENDSVLCHTCLRAKTDKKLTWSANGDASFVSKGYKLDATLKFLLHETSKSHKEACLKVRKCICTRLLSSHIL